MQEMENRGYILKRRYHGTMLSRANIDARKRVVDVVRCWHLVRLRHMELSKPVQGATCVDMRPTVGTCSGKIPCAPSPGSAGLPSVELLVVVEITVFGYTKQARKESTWKLKWAKSVFEACVKEEKTHRAIQLS